MFILSKIWDFIKSRQIFLFGVLGACIWWIMDYNKLLTNPPSGLHFIRQTDSLSFVLGYLKNGLNFFEPATLNLSSVNGRAACEFPIIYYLCACIAKLGISPYISLRLVHFIILLFGLYSFGKAVLMLTKNYVVSCLLPMILFGSTVMAYYALNYLPDIAAFGFCLAGCSYFLMFRLYPQGQHIRKFYAGMACTTVASLIKITFLIYPIAFTTFFLIVPGTKALKSRIIIPFLFSGLLVFLWWFLFVIGYNEKNQSRYFMTAAAPFWKLNLEEIGVTWNYIYVFWRNAFLHLSVWITFFISLSLIFFTKGFRKAEQMLLMTILGFGIIVYLILFFEKFKDHDYYFLTSAPYILITFFIGLERLEIEVRSRMNNLIVSLIIVLVVIVSISYSSQKVLNRIVVQPDFFTEELIGIEKIDLSFYGIDEENTIGVFGDRTMNGSLSLLNRKGLTKSLGESYVQQSSYRNLNDMDYFIVLDEECFDEFLAENPIAYSEINSSGKFKILKNLSR